MRKYLLITAIFLKTNILFSQIKNTIDDGRKIKIPIAFHVIYNSENENIADSSILNELKDLNLDFSATNDMSLLDNDFRNIIGNPNIEFYLLDTAFQITGLKGVRRIASSKKHKRNDLLINPTNCVNVFIARQGNNAPFIGAGNGSVANRVNLNYVGVGKHSHGLTHEIGHWLGLYHIFGQVGNSSWRNRTFGKRNDLVDDTPEQKGATAVCYFITCSCPCPPKKQYYKKHKRLYNNFMDYNPCRCMFTIGQTVRIRNKIIEDRQTLFETSK